MRQAFRPRNTSMMNAAAQSIRPSLVKVRVRVRCMMRGRVKVRVRVRVRVRVGV